jgi:hypothetical protein
MIVLSVCVNNQQHDGGFWLNTGRADCGASVALLFRLCRPVR